MVENLEKIHRGERVYIDANIFHLYLRGPESIKKQCKSFIERIKRGEIVGYTSVLVLDEFIYRMLLKLIEVDYKENPIEVLRREKFDIVKKYSGLIGGFLKKILNITNLKIFPVALEDIIHAFTILSEVGLLPRDAIHLAIMYKNDIKALASMDSDFDVVKGITRYSPTLDEKS